MSLSRVSISNLIQVSTRYPLNTLPKTWWGPIWRGLVVEDAGKHYQVMRSSIWLYLYLVIHADRQTGRLQRRVATIATDMGITLRTIQHWLSCLRKHHYITTVSNGRSLQIQIQRWKPAKKRKLDTR